PPGSPLARREIESAHAVHVELRRSQRTERKVFSARSTFSPVDDRDSDSVQRHAGCAVASARGAWGDGDLPAAAAADLAYQAVRSPRASVVSPRSGRGHRAAD